MFIKSPDFMKSSLPWKVSGSVLAYIWYKQSDFCSLELYWQYLQKSWWSSGMIPEKVTWVRFPARINTVYSKLSPITDLFLKILNQTGICQVFRCSCRISDQKIFSAMLHQNIVHQNKFFNFSPNSLHSFVMIWPF